MDSLRVLASVGIVGLHLAQHTTIWPAWHERLDALRYLVDVFFVLSGYLLARLYGGLTFGPEYWRFLQKRIARLAPLHWATALVFVLVGVAVALGKVRPDDPSVYDLRNLPANLLLVHAWTGPAQTFNGPSWSISAEFLMYLLLPAFLLWKRALWVGVVIAFAWVYLSGGFDQPTAYRAFPTFMLGVALAQIGSFKLPFAKTFLLGSIGLYFAAVLLGAPKIVSLGLALLMPILCIPADASDNRDLALHLSPLGSLTYSIYMIHPVVVLVGVAFVGERVLHLTGTAMDLYVVSMTIPILVASVISYRFFEMPARRVIAGVRIPRRAVA